MRVRHLNCGTMRPAAGRTRLVSHCLLAETEQGLVLVDTGIGLSAVRRPREWLGTGFLQMTRPLRDETEAAVRQVAALGYDPEDVRHIVLTHLDLDHAGGLADFPRATVHLHEAEYQAAMRPALPERPRYRKVQWAHGPRWTTYRETEGEPWFGFAAVRKLAGLPEDLLLVPLPGHTRGHTGVAVDTGDGWLLHAGDAYMHRHDVKPGGRPSPMLSAFQTIVQSDGKARTANRDRLADLVTAHSDDVTVFCAHDPVELGRHTLTPQP
jgi:glyoxylase-like metal-dependent hydrolase (beta-lactamase superfamily II)